MAFPEQELLRQTLTTRRACPICGSREAEWLTTMNFALPEASPLPPGYDLVVCRRCGCGFADSKATEADYAKYYRVFSKYEESSIATGSGNDPHDRMRLDELAAYLSSRVVSSARIADVGAGNGGLLKSLLNWAINISRALILPLFASVTCGKPGYMPAFWFCRWMSPMEWQA